MTIKPLPGTTVSPPASVRARLIVSEYEQVSGLSRYASMLYRELQRLPGVDATLVPARPPRLPDGLWGLGRRLGFDVARFLETYPVTWPDVGRAVVHLTQRSHATLLLRRTRRPVVVTVHDIIHYQYRHDPAMHIYLHPIQRWFDMAAIGALRRAAAILASSDYTRRALIEEVGVPADRVHTVHLGVDREQFRPCAVPQAFYGRYGLSAQVPYVLHISTDEPRKNLPALIQAFATVRLRHPETMLLKIGWPLYPRERERSLGQLGALGLRDAVIFIDDLPDGDLVYFYNVARLLALPSRAEGFGLPVLEAMACGLPVVCSSAASLPEVAGDAAWLVDPDDVPGLAAAIGSLLDDPSLAGRMVQAGLARAAVFSWARTARQTLEVYASVLEGSIA